MHDDFLPDPDSQSSTITHYSGPTIQFGSVQRQRCAWCGYVLVDDDLANMSFQIPDCSVCGATYMEGEKTNEHGTCIDPDGEGPHHHVFENPKPPNGFIADRFLEVTENGGFRGIYLVDEESLEDGTLKVPGNACMRLPVGMTGESPIGSDTPDSVDPS